MPSVFQFPPLTPFAKKLLIGLLGAFVMQLVLENWAGIPAFRLLALVPADLGPATAWQVLTYALGAWFAQLDGVVSTSEHETLVALGNKLGLDDPMRKRAAAAAFDIACLPEGGKPGKYDFGKLVARLKEKLPQVS